MFAFLRPWPRQLEAQKEVFSRQAAQQLASLTDGDYAESDDELKVMVPVAHFVRLPIHGSKTLASPGLRMQPATSGFAVNLLQCMVAWQDMLDKSISKLASMRTDHASLRSAVNDKRLEAEALKEAYAKVMFLAWAYWERLHVVPQTGHPLHAFKLQECKRHGKLTAEHDAAAANRHQRDAFIRSTAAKLGIRLPPTMAGAEDGQQAAPLPLVSVESFVSELSKRRTEAEQQLGEMKAQHRCLHCAVERSF